jgi:inhibitor of cysteine peptidase
MISLKGNPTTGYSWNASVTDGLVLKDLGFTENEHAPNMTGVGGVYRWDVVAVKNGTQKFTAIYKRPWEPTIGNETTFVLTFQVK